MKSKIRGVRVCSDLPLWTETSGSHWPDIFGWRYDFSMYDLLQSHGKKSEHSKRVWLACCRGLLCMYRRQWRTCSQQCHQGSCTTSRSGLIAQIDLLLRQLSLLYTGTFSKLLNRAANFSAFDNKLQGWQIAGNHATPWTILESLWKPMNHMTDGQSEETRWEIWSNRRRREKTCAEGGPAQHPIDLPPRVSLEPGVKSTRPRPAGHSHQFTIPANSHGCCWGQWQHLRTTSPPIPATHCCRLGQRSRKWPRPSCWCRSAATPLPQTGGSNSSGKQWQAAVWASANHERTFELALQLHQEPQEPSGRKVSPYLLGRNPPP